MSQTNVRELTKRGVVSLSPGRRKNSKLFYKGYSSCEATIEQLVAEHKNHSVSSYIYRSGTTSGGEFCAGHRAGESVERAGNVMLFDFDKNSLSFEQIQARLAGLVAGITPSKSWTPDRAKFHVIVLLDQFLPMDKHEFTRWYKAVAQQLGFEGHCDTAMASWVQQLAPYWDSEGPVWAGGGEPLCVADALATYHESDPAGGLGSGVGVCGHVPDDWVLTLSSTGERVAAPDLYHFLEACEARKVRTHCGRGLAHDGRKDTAFVSMRGDGTAVYHCSGGRCGETLLITEPFDVIEDVETEVIEAVVNEVGEVVSSGHGPVSGWDRYVFVPSDNRVFDFTAGLWMSAAAFNTLVSGWNRTLPGGNQVSGVTFLVQTNRFVDVVFNAPRFGRFFELFDMRCANSYRGLPRLERGEDATAWKIIDEYLKNMFRTEKEARCVLQWMAHQVQRPGVKLHWAPVLCGVQGDGKSTIAKILRTVMGAWNVNDVSVSEVFSSFTGYMEGSCVNVLEEIRVNGHTRYEVMDKLKPAITNDIVSVHRKGRDAVNVINFTNYIALTNHEDALALDDSDRRWLVLFTRWANRAAMKAACNSAYWDRVHDAYQKNPGVIRDWLMSVDLSDFPITEAPYEFSYHKNRMIEAAKSDDSSAIEQALEDVGEVFTAEEVVDILHKSRVMINTVRVGKLLRKYGKERYPKKVRCLDGHLRRFWYTQGLLDAVPDEDKPSVLKSIFDDFGRSVPD